MWINHLYWIRNYIEVFLRMKVAIYIRVSTRDKQDISKQRDYLMNYCKQRELEIYKVYQDRGISGSKQARPGLDEMLEEMPNYDAILVYKLDRLGRSFKHLFELIDLFKEKNIEFVSATENIDTSTPAGNLFFHMAASFSQYEREMIVQRVNDGLASARKRGVKLGRPKGAKDRKPRRKVGYYLRYEE